MEQENNELEDRPYWIELEGQFTSEEFDLFKYHWGRIISQFKDDVSNRRLQARRNQVGTVDE